MDPILTAIHAELGIDHAHLAANKLAPHAEPPLASLEVVAIDFEGKPFLLIAEAAAAWRAMARAALADGIKLLPHSGFRSYLYQKRLIEGHLKNGRELRLVLTHLAIPGFSEHHTGRAVDIHAEGRPVLEEEFERTEAFAWLAQNAGRFRFTLSYPRGNRRGIVFEPWHWCYAEG